MSTHVARSGKDMVRTAGPRRRWRTLYGIFPPADRIAFIPRSREISGLSTYLAVFLASIGSACAGPTLMADAEQRPDIATAVDLPVGDLRQRTPERFRLEKKPPVLRTEPRHSRVKRMNTRPSNIRFGYPAPRHSPHHGASAQVLERHRERAPYVFDRPMHLLFPLYGSGIRDHERGLEMIPYARHRYTLRKGDSLKLGLHTHYDMGGHWDFLSGADYVRKQKSSPLQEFDASRFYIGVKHDF